MRQPPINRRSRATPYRIGYEMGYRNGRSAGREAYGTPFEGTSIIIPTYNQLGLLRKCIRSIQRYTLEPYELIVVDNGSRDGTARYLRSLSGRVRCKLNRDNRGFAGGVNQGLMMARGSTLVLLNNDTVVTRNWLGNLLAGLRSDPRIGLAGPMTNEISGQQRIPVRYRSLQEMHRFAEDYNQTDSSRWIRTDSIMGFCLVLQRSTFERAGFLDERFAIGTCEDVDYYLRVRLLGLELAIAGDTFIHHYGSATMRSFKDAAVMNNQVFLEKWGGHQGLHQLEDCFPKVEEHFHRRSTDYYPDGVLVQDGASRLYWVEQGIRRPVTGETVFGGVRLSLPELRQWPLGESISVQELASRRNCRQDGSLAVEGEWLRSEGAVYQLSRGMLRPFVGQRAWEEWKDPGRIVREMPLELLERMPRGLPILAPPLLPSDI